MESEMGYIVAKGPEGLLAVLSELLEKSKTDSTLKMKAHYILYELGNQKSMIKMDLSEMPVMFWHYDLLGRPATMAVKETLARFAWQRCGERDWYLNQKGGEAAYFKTKGASEETAFAEWLETNFEGKSGLT